MLSKRKAGNLLPIITNESSGISVVDARELHAKLSSGYQFADWIKAYISTCEYQEGVDYLVFQNFLKNPKGGRPTMEYHLTMDMAKEICMLERNETGRMIRRYFIEAEKKLTTKRLYAQTTNLSEINKKLKPRSINGRKMYKYRELQRLLGYSTKSNVNNVRRCYAGQLVVLDGISYVSEEYTRLLISRATSRALASEARNAEPVLPLEFNQLTLALKP
jgi:phage anti-repressor protein